MSAIVIRPHPDRSKMDSLFADGTDYMPFATRHLVAKELNRLWAEFVTEMHDGPTVGNDVAEKFWQFVSTRGA